MTTAYTVRDQLLARETETPNHAATAVEVFRHDLNANGRHQPRGWRTEVTASVLADRLPELLTGGFGLGPQLHAFRRVNPIKAKTLALGRKPPWTCWQTWPSTLTATSNAHAPSAPRKTQCPSRCPLCRTGLEVSLLDGNTDHHRYHRARASNPLVKAQKTVLEFELSTL